MSKPVVDLMAALEASLRGPWRCGFTGLVWEGDISNHHGIEPGKGYCPGPHLRVEAGEQANER